MLPDDGVSASVCSLWLSSVVSGKGEYLGTMKETSIIRVTPARMRVYPKTAWTYQGDNEGRIDARGEVGNLHE